MMKHKILSIEPTIDKTALVTDSDLGAWTDIGVRAEITESRLGDYTAVGNDALVSYSTVGKFCQIGAWVAINPDDHHQDRPALHHFTHQSWMYVFSDDDDAFHGMRREKSVEIGNDVWIGHGAIILPGVTIGNGAVINEGSVVSKHVPAYSIVAGNPGEVLRDRFTDDIKVDLDAMAWWDWPRAGLKAALPDFRNLPIAEFIQKYKASSPVDSPADAA